MGTVSDPWRPAINRRFILMRRALRSRPSPAMVVALLALFVALGGSGYAAVQLNGKTIKNGTIAAEQGT